MSNRASSEVKIAGNTRKHESWIAKTSERFVRDTTSNPTRVSVWLVEGEVGENPDDEISAMPTAAKMRAHTQPVVV